jgi:hypothetical protein
MIRRAALAALTLCIAAAPPAWSADADGAYAIKGLGRKTCAEAAVDLGAGAGAKTVYGAWLEGYVTGINRSSEGLYDLTPWQTPELLLSVVVQACVPTPDDKLIVALDRVLRGMSPLRMTERAPIVALRKGGSYVNIYETVLNRAIARLDALGHSPGPAAPRVDARVVRAIGDFQASRGLPETGIPDQATLFNLFVEVPPPAD